MGECAWSPGVTLYKGKREMNGKWEIFLNIFIEVDMVNFIF